MRSHRASLSEGSRGDQCNSALYLTVRTDPYVSLREVRRLYRLTASPVKDLVLIPSGPAGFYMIDFSSYAKRARNAILSFVRRLARVRPS